MKHRLIWRATGVVAQGRPWAAALVRRRGLADDRPDGCGAAVLLCERGGDLRDAGRRTNDDFCPPPPTQPI